MPRENHTPTYSYFEYILFCPRYAPDITPTHPSY